MTRTDLCRGDVVLVAFPFVRAGVTHRKRRPAVVIQSDHYNKRRAAVILAAITSRMDRADLPCKVTVLHDDPEGRRAGLRTDSLVDCQTLVTVPRGEIVARLGRFPASLRRRMDRAIEDALGLPGPSQGTTEVR